MSNKSIKNFKIDYSDNKDKNIKKEDKYMELNIGNGIDDKHNKLNKINLNNNSMLKKIIMKVKDELAKEEIKNEINNIVHPLYEDIYNKVFPHYFTLVTLLIVIALLLILIIVLNVINFKQSNK
jgi:hypothetical protein